MKKDFVIFVWELFMIDGGVKVKNYVIDKRELIRKVYVNVSNKCSKISFKVENFIEGVIYYFRVMVENEFGVGVLVEIVDVVKVVEFFFLLGKVIFIDVF